MATMYESGLEPARQDFPEVTAAERNAGQGPQPYQGSYDHQYPQAYYPHLQQEQQHYDSPITPPKHEASQLSPAPPSTYGGQTATSPFSSYVQPVTAPTTAERVPISARRIFGCSFLVFVLSCIIALLAAAAIGLAAATGIVAQRANSASSSLAAALDPTTITESAIDGGCLNNPEGVNKTEYTSFSLLGGLRFTRYCNRDAPHAPLVSLFAANFDTCIDACAAYTRYVPVSFGNVENSTCEAVSFIPAWTNKTRANAGGAPGNCYLKAGPQDEAQLTTPNIGVNCHAAILTSSE